MPQTKAPLRIAFLTHEPFYPPSGGGSAEAVYLVEEMIRRGHEVHVFGPQIDDAANVEEKFHIRLHQFEGSWGIKCKMGRYAKFRNFKYLAYPFFLEDMVEDAAQETKFDLLFSQHAISAVAAGKLKRKLKIPVVMNFPDLLTGFMETWPSYRRFFGVVKWLVDKAMSYELSLPARYKVDGVLAISDRLAGLFSERGYPREKICPIYYGYDAEKFPLREQLPPPGKPPVIFMHGSFDAHHLNIILEDAIRYIAKKKEENTKIIFRFIGVKTVAIKELLKRLRKENLKVKFEEIDFVPYDEITKYLRDANVGIVPYVESAGTHCAFVAKIVEYIATGLPTVCTPLKSVQGYFKNDPMVKFSEFNGEDFGKKILAWLDEPVSNWQPHATKSAARVKAELDWQPLCRKAVDFVEKTYSIAKTPS